MPAVGMHQTCVCLCLNSGESLNYQVLSRLSLSSFYNFTLMKLIYFTPSSSQQQGYYSFEFSLVFIFI